MPRPLPVLKPAAEPISALHTVARRSSAAVGQFSDSSSTDNMAVESLSSRVVAIALEAVVTASKSKLPIDESESGLNLVPARAAGLSARAAGLSARDHLSLRSAISDVD